VAAIVVAGVLLRFGYVVASAVVAAIAVLLGLFSLISRRFREALSAGLAYLGRTAAKIATFVVLAPVYLIGFTAARLWQSLGRADPLQLRDEGRPSFWVECNQRVDKTRYASRMFLKEPTFRAARTRPVAIAACLLLLLGLLGEGLLQFWGFGHPLLYVNDAQIGYYPAPNQEVRRYGGLVRTNQFGMRSPHVEREKPPGTFRVFMIGDSTLYGGSYIDQEELYSRFVERELKSRHRGGRVEILAMGVNEWSPIHKLEYARKFGTFDADVAVICLPIGDIYRRCHGATCVATFTPRRPPMCAYEEVAKHFLWRYFAGISGKPTEASREIQAERGIQAYVELGRLFRDNGCEVFYEILPGRTLGCLETVPAKERQRIAEQLRGVDRLQTALARGGFDRVSFPRGLFIGKGAPETLYHDKCHLFQLGHRLYAGYLADRLSSKSTRLARWSRESTLQAHKGDSREHLRR
jgi:hypothetical protein